MTPMLEAAAKAAYDAMIVRLRVAHPEIPEVPWEDEPEELREDWRHSTRAAVTELLGGPDLEAVLA